MSVPVQSPVNSSIANGSTITFAYSFYLLAAADLQVFINGVQVATGYSVTGVGTVAGGSVVFVTPPAANSIVTLARILTLARVTNYVRNGDLLAATINSDFDRLWMVAQQHDLEIALSLHIPPEVAGQKTLLPLAASRALKPLIFDASGNVSVGAEAYREPSSILASADAAAAARDVIVLQQADASAAQRDITVLDRAKQVAEWLVAGVVGGMGAFLANGVGAILRTFQDKERDIISVKDYGAKGDGVTDDTAAILATYVLSSQPLFPEGDYLTSITATHRYRGPGVPRTLAGLVAPNFINPTRDQTFVVVINGQSNAEGVHNGGGNPANPLVKVWDGVTGAWGSSDYTLAPFSRSTPDGNGSNNNVGLSFAHRLVDEYGAKVYVIYDAVGGVPIADWVSTGITSVRYAAIKSKIEAALASAELVAAKKTAIDFFIWAQGEEDALTATIASYRASFTTLDQQLRAETWMDSRTPLFIMGMSGLHNRYQVWQAQIDYCENLNRNCIYVNSAGLQTSYDVSSAVELDVDNITNFNVGDTLTAGQATATVLTVATGVINAIGVVGAFSPGVPVTSSSGGTANISAVDYTSDYTHWLGPALWESGYYRVWAALKDRGVSHRQLPVAFFGRGIGPWRGDTVAISMFNSLVSLNSATNQYPYNASGNSNAISWGYLCTAASYGLAGGYQNTMTSGANYSACWGRLITFAATGQYAAGFGYQNALNATYAFAAGRGHTVADSGGAAFGTFSKYTTAQTDAAMFQVGIGTSASVAKNGITVRQSGAVEINVGSTADPTQSQEIKFEYVGNTSVKLKMRGTDGVVRSVTLTLA